MTLQTVVTARVSNQRLVNLTNPDLPAPTTIDTTRLGYACAEAEGEFQVHAQDVFDETDARHIAPAIDLVILLLQERGSAPTEGLGAQREKIIQRLKDLALVTGRNRVMPSTVEEDRGAFNELLMSETTLDPQTDVADEFDEDDE